MGKSALWKEINYPFSKNVFLKVFSKIPFARTFFCGDKWFKDKVQKKKEEEKPPLNQVL